MKNNFLILRTFAILFLIIILTGCIPISFTYATKNGSELRVKSTQDTNLIIIGDSRMYQLYLRNKELKEANKGSYKEDKLKAHYICVWGGHYVKAVGKNGKPIPNYYRIDNDTNKQFIKRMIDEITDRNINPRVFIEATVNDYTGANSTADCTSSVNAQIALAEEIAKYNEKAEVYVGSLIPVKNGDATKYNNLLKEKASNSEKGITYIDIKPTQVNYSTDNIHFTSDTCEAVYNKIKTEIIAESNKKTSNNQKTESKTETKDENKTESKSIFAKLKTLILRIIKLIK